MITKKQPPKKTKVVAAKKVVAKTKKVLAAKKVVKVATKKAVAKKVKKTKSMPSLKKGNVVEKISHKKESALKRFCYMTLAIILGLLLGTFVHLFVELAYFKKAQETGMDLPVNHFLGIYSFLPMPFVLMALLAGLVFGIWLGTWGWNMVYVQRRHRMFRKA
jgi:hypothetical protein